jgi:hypothetical protein
MPRKPQKKPVKPRRAKRPAPPPSTPAAKQETRVGDERDRQEPSGDSSSPFAGKGLL